MLEGLTFDDVLLIPNYSEILPQDVSLMTRFSKNIPLKSPLISAPMDTVTEHKMAISIALEGGIGIIHKNLSPEKQAQEVQSVKRFENGFINDPATINVNALVDDVYEIFQKTGYKKIPVVDDKQILVGLITELDYLMPIDKGKKVGKVMTPLKDLITAKKGVSLEEANEIIRERKLAVLCVIDKDLKLDSIVTRRDLIKNKEYPQANKDKNKRLYVGAAIGVGDDSLERAKLLVQAGVDAIIVDTAHGHSRGVMQMIKKLKSDKNTKGIDVVAGNVASKQAGVDLVKAGVDGIKVGVGPGSICTTRVVAGVGVPQITAVMEVVKGIGKSTVPVIADGGIKYSGDIVKALAAGAESVMMGGLFAGAEESPGETEFTNGKMYKVYRGMGSIAAMEKGSKDRYGQGKIKDAQKFVPEGIEGRIPYRGPVDKIIYQLLGGIKSGMGYNGARNIKELQKNSQFVRITGAGLKESHPHDVVQSKDAPNYPLQ